MNARVLTLASISLLALATTSAAVPEPEVATELSQAVNQELSGEVTEVDLEKMTFSIRVDDRETSIQIDSNTKYQLDGKDATRGEVLKVGQTVTVTHEKQLASKVAASSKS